MGRAVWDGDAAEDLRQIVHRIGIEEARPAAARKLAARIRRECERFARNPLIGESRADLLPHLRQFTVRPYVVFYFPLDDGIRVARVIHGARDYPALFS